MANQAKRIYQAFKVPCALALSLALSGGLSLLPGTLDFALQASAEQKTSHPQGTGKATPLEPTAKVDLGGLPFMDIAVELPSLLMLLEDGKPVFEPVQAVHPQTNVTAERTQAVYHFLKRLWTNTTDSTKKISLTPTQKMPVATKTPAQKTFVKEAVISNTPAITSGNNKQTADKTIVSSVESLKPIEELVTENISAQLTSTDTPPVSMPAFLEDAYLALQSIINDTPRPGSTVKAKTESLSPATIEKTSAHLKPTQAIASLDNNTAKTATKEQTAPQTKTAAVIQKAVQKTEFIASNKKVENTKTINAQPAAKAQALVASKPTHTKAVPANKAFSGELIEESYNLLSSNILDNLEEADTPSVRTANAKFPTSGKLSKLPPLMSPIHSPALDMNSGVKVLRSGVSSTVNEIDVTINKAVILNLSQPAARVSISNPDIASVVVISPMQIQLIGNQVGVANLLVWGNTNSPEHTIVDVQVHRDVSVLAQQLKYVDPGIQVAPLAAEDTVILTGQAANRESAQLAVDLAKAFFKGGGGGSTAMPGGSGGKSSTSSTSPGSAMPGATPNIINLINIKGEPSTKLELAQQKLKAIDPGIELDIVPGVDGTEKAILTGRVKTASLISKAINTTSVFYGQPGIKLITGPGGNSVRSAAGNNSFPTNDAFNDNLDINVLQGSVMTDTSGNVISMLEVSQKPQIKCSIQFIEISKNNLDALGSALFGANEKYSWSSLSGSQSTPAGRAIATLDQDHSGSLWSNTYNPMANTRSSSMTSGFSQNLSNGITQAFSINQKFTAAITALEEKRKARTLAEPTLTLLSGEKASFLAGGEVPIPMLGANGQVNVDYHEFGIRLNLVATYLDSGKIHMLVSPEISAVDTANSVTSGGVTVPGFRTRRMQSTLELEQGQSFVLAGLYNQDEVWSLSRLPGAGSIPVLGALMRNKWKTSSRTELIVIIKPEVDMVDSDPIQPVSYTPVQNIPANPAP